MQGAMSSGAITQRKQEVPFVLSQAVYRLGIAFAVVCLLK